MASLNRIMLIGGVGKDPEVRQFQDGAQVCNFTLATSESYTDRSGEKKEDTTWHNIVLNGKLAGLSQYIHKGSKLYVEGKIRNRSYQTQNGETRYVTEVVGLGVQLLDSKPQAQLSAPAQQPSYPPQGGYAPQPGYAQAAPAQAPAQVAGPQPPAQPGYPQPPMPPAGYGAQPPQPPLPPMSDPAYTLNGSGDLPF